MINGDVESQSCRRWKDYIKHGITFLYVIVLAVVIPFLIWPLIHGDPGTHNPKKEAMVISTVFLLLTLPISIYSVANHLVNFNQPELQRPICRVLLMVPVYSVTSFLSLRFTQYSIYFDTLREWYEAYALYNFMALVLRFLERSYDLRYVLEYKPRQMHIIPFCCLPPFPHGQKFILNCKSGVVQYSFIRTLTTLIALCTQLADKYHEGDFHPQYAYLYIVIINNISQIWAMYCLISLYYVMRIELRPLNPISKFSAIKLVVFMTFWQSVLLAMLVFFKILEPKETWAWQTPKELANGLQAFLIIIEMFCLSLLHHYAFPVRPFIEGGIRQFETDWTQQIRDLWDHSDIRDDVREHVRVIGDAVQGGANIARGRIGDLLHNQTWPPRVSPTGTTTNGSNCSTNDPDCQTRPLLDESFSSHSREYS